MCDKTLKLAPLDRAAATFLLARKLFYFRSSILDQEEATQTRPTAHTVYTVKELE